MQGIVSIPDRTHSDQIEALWRELETEFELTYACTAYPHFSYQVVERYDVEPALKALSALAAETQPFTVTTSGLGIFTGERPVLDIRVVRTTALSLFHDRVWAAVAPFATNAHEQHYGPTHWIPHMTLAINDLTHEALPDVIRLLSRRNFSWEMPIDNLCLVLDARGGRDAWLPIKLGRGG